MDLHSTLVFRMNDDFVKIKTSILRFYTDRPITEDANKLKGYVANQFREYSIFHNHYGNRCLFTDSKVHYMIINGVGYILGIKEGAEAIKMLSNFKELHLGNSIYTVRPIFCDKEEIIAKTDKFIQYDLIHYWLPFDDENYEKSKTLIDQRDKKLFINNILRGNIMSLCKGLGLNVDKRDHTVYVHSKLKKSISWYKVARTSYMGEFMTNMILPDMFGLGEKVSAGFGVIKRRLECDHFLTKIKDYK